MEEIKVLEVLDSYYPKFDGPILVITSYSKSFSMMEGVSAEVAVPRVPKYTDDQPFNVFRTKSIKSVEGYYAGMPKFDRKLKKYLKEKNFDIIHIHSPFTMGRFFVNYGKKHNIPVVYTFHTKFREDFERILKYKWMQNFMMKYIMKTINNADYILTVSNGAKDTLIEYGCTKNIEVIRNGTDLKPTEQAKNNVSIVNEIHGLHEQKNVFLSVGRIVENKRIDLVIKALSIVNKTNQNFKFIIVGDGPHLNKLKQLVKELNLETNVIFTGKITDRDLLSAYYLRSDLFMFPSTFDTASLAPIEAAALSLPSLMTKGCSTAEIITENVNGFLSEDSIDAWATKILQIMNMNNKLQKVKEKAHSEVFRTWDSVAEEVLEKYREYISDYKTKHNL